MSVFLFIGFLLQVRGKVALPSVSQNMFFALVVGRRCKALPTALSPAWGLRPP